MRKNGVRTLLMGGQACVFYGAAEFSRDLDLLVPTEPENIERLAEALRELAAESIRSDVAATGRAIREEEDVQRAADREYWEPLKRELEQLRRVRKRLDVQGN